MKTFLRKLKLSFLAMVCGWIACNIAWWVGALLAVHFDERRIPEPAMQVLYFGAATGFVILINWLVIFLPVDLVIPDLSRLRRPVAAAIGGFIAGSSVIVVSWAWSIYENDSLHHLLARLQWKALPFMLTPGITGMVAAYVRSRDPNPAHTKP